MNNEGEDSLMRELERGATKYGGKNWLKDYMDTMGQIDYHRLFLDVSAKDSSIRNQIINLIPVTNFSILVNDLARIFLGQYYDDYIKGNVTVSPGRFTESEQIKKEGELKEIIQYINKSIEKFEYNAPDLDAIDVCIKALRSFFLGEATEAFDSTDKSRRWRVAEGGPRGRLPYERMLESLPDFLHKLRRLELFEEFLGKPGFDDPRSIPLLLLALYVQLQIKEKQMKNRQEIQQGS